MKRIACLYVFVVLYAVTTSLAYAEQSGPREWVAGIEAFPIYKQTNADDLNLYVDKDWANTNFKGIPRKNETCLAVVYAMLEHARGNTGYRIGQPGTWKDEVGAIDKHGVLKARDIHPDPGIVVQEISADRPVILQGFSDRLGTNHFMLAVGLTADREIIALDPLSGAEVLIPLSKMVATLTEGDGSTLSFTVIYLRTLEYVLPEQSKAPNQPTVSREAGNPDELDKQASSEEANTMFVEAVKLFRQSQDLDEATKSKAYAKVRLLFDRILWDYPNSRPAQVLLDQDAPAGIVLADLPPPYKFPDGWNDAKRAIARDLLQDYSKDVDTIELVSNASDYAVLAWAAYLDSQAIETAKSAGWRQVMTFTGASLLTGDAFAVVFADENDNHVLAFRGSHDWKDWITNTAGTVSAAPLLTEQVSDAARIAGNAKKLFPDIVFSGHSLGGRLARVASYTTGNDAYVFNSAPIGVKELKRHSIDLLLRNKIYEFRSPQDPVSAMLPADDVEVANIVEANLVSRLNPATAIPTAQDYTHSMTILAKAMSDVELAWEGRWIEAYRYELGQVSLQTEIFAKPAYCFISTIEQCSDIQLCDNAVRDEPARIRGAKFENLWKNELDARGARCIKLEHLTINLENEAKQNLCSGKSALCTTEQLCASALRYSHNYAKADPRSTVFYKEMSRRKEICPEVAEIASSFIENDCSKSNVSPCSTDELCKGAVRSPNMQQSAYFLEMQRRGVSCDKVQAELARLERASRGQKVAGIVQELQAERNFRFAETDDNGVPLYEGVYARMGTGKLISLGRGLERNKIATIRLGSSTRCNRCIPISFDGPSAKAFHPIEYKNFLRLNLDDIQGFVVRTRYFNRKMFLSNLTEVKQFTENFQGQPTNLGEPFPYVEGAYLGGFKTDALNTSSYKFFVRSLSGVTYSGLATRHVELFDGSHAPEKLPPFLVDANCGWGPDHQNVKQRLVDEFTTEFVLDFSLAGISKTHQHDQCGKNATIDSYGFVLRIGDRVYPITSNELMASYIAQYTDSWGPLEQALLP